MKPKSIKYNEKICLRKTNYKTVGPYEVQKIIYPRSQQPLLTGFALAFARGVGEYGSVIFIAGNQPYQTEIAPLLIISRLEEYDYAGATTIAVVMLVISFIFLFNLNKYFLILGRGKEEGDNKPTSVLDLFINFFYLDDFFKTRFG